jgi:hypothetical protein
VEADAVEVEADAVEAEADAVEAEAEADAVVLASPEAEVAAEVASPEAAIAVSREAAEGIFREGVRAGPLGLGLESLIVPISAALVRGMYRVPDEAAVLAIELPVSG